MYVIEVHITYVRKEYITDYTCYRGIYIRLLRYVQRNIYQTITLCIEEHITDYICYRGIYISDYYAMYRGIYNRLYMLQRNIDQAINHTKQYITEYMCPNAEIQTIIKYIAGERRQLL